MIANARSIRNSRDFLSGFEWHTRRNSQAQAVLESTELDSNIFIYLANGTLDRHLIAKRDIAHASVVKIVALGYMRIPANELLLLEALFGESYNLPLTDPIIERAIRLRQQKRMSLGDSIVAATAQEYGCNLWTANVDDYAHIENLVLVNPLG